MLRKTKTFRQHLPQGEMNIVSFMDILTTLLFFLLIGASFSHISGLDSSGFVPADASAPPNEKPAFTLEAIAANDHEATLWLGPTAALEVQPSSELAKFLAAEFKGDPQTGYTKKITAANLDATMAEARRVLIEIKKGYPHETSAVAAFSDTITYQQMVKWVENIKTLDEKSPGFELVNAIGARQRTKVLFPSITISEWVEGGGHS